MYVHTYVEELQVKYSQFSAGLGCPRSRAVFSNCVVREGRDGFETLPANSIISGQTGWTPETNGQCVVIHFIATVATPSEMYSV